jgi:hypothetical protein
MGIKLWSWTSEGFNFGAGEKKGSGDELGELNHSTDGSTSVGLGSGMSVDTKGRVGIDLGSGMTIKTDGTIDFGIF